MKDKQNNNKSNDTSNTISVIPIHTIVYIVFFSLSLGFLSAVLLFKIKLGYIYDMYYTICGILISIGLLITSLASLKDWNDFINNKINKKGVMINMLELKELSNATNCEERALYDITNQKCIVTGNIFGSPNILGTINGILLGFDYMNIPYKELESEKVEPNSKLFYECRFTGEDE